MAGWMRWRALSGRRLENWAKRRETVRGPELRARIPLPYADHGARTAVAAG
jgi:hypothetical protein